MSTYSSVEQIIASYPVRFKPEKAAGVQAVIQLVFKGDGGGTYQLHIDDGTLEIVEGPHPSPTLTAEASVSDWLLLNNGDIAPLGLVMGGRMRFTGSLATAMRFRSMFETAS
ncbi:MAG: SCP2 sterol-binding domain-containing protein [Bacteroidota bacterium]